MIYKVVAIYLTMSSISAKPFHPIQEEATILNSNPLVLLGPIRYCCCHQKLLTEYGKDKN